MVHSFKNHIAAKVICAIVFCATLVKPEPSFPPVVYYIGHSSKMFMLSDETFEIP